VTTSSQAEINPETNAVLMQLNLSISRQDDCRLGYTVTPGHAAESARLGRRLTAAYRDGSSPSAPLGTNVLGCAAVQPTRLAHGAFDACAGATCRRRNSRTKVPSGAGPKSHAATGRAVEQVDQPLIAPVTPAVSCTMTSPEPSVAA
jgi:hypothetical protein